MIDRTRIEKLSASLQAVIDVWAEENGLERTSKFNIRFGENNFKVTSSLEFVEAEAKETVEMRNFEHDLRLINAKHRTSFAANIYGKTVHLPQGNFQIVGINTRAPKYPFVVRNSAGESRRVTVNFVKAQMFTNG